MFQISYTIIHFGDCSTLVKSVTTTKTYRTGDEERRTYGREERDDKGGR